MNLSRSFTSSFIVQTSSFQSGGSGRSRTGYAHLDRMGAPLFAFGTELFSFQSGSRGGSLTHFVPLCRRMPQCSATRPCLFHFGVLYRNRTGSSSLTSSRATITLRTPCLHFWSNEEESNLHVLRIGQPCRPLHHRSIGIAGFEPAASWFQTRRSQQAELYPVIPARSLRLCKRRPSFWSERPDSNRRSPASEAGAFATTLHSELKEEVRTMNDELRRGCHFIIHRSYFTLSQSWPARSRTSISGFKAQRRPFGPQASLCGASC